MTEPADALFDRPFRDVLRLTAAKTPYAGGGAVSAMTAASAVSLLLMVAEYSDAPTVVSEFTPALDELSSLADADADAFSLLLAAWGMERDDPERPAAVARGAVAACEVPLQVCEVGARVASVAADLARTGKRDLEGDAFAASSLAAAAVATSANLVRLNAGYGKGAADPLAARAAELARQAVDAAATAERTP